MDHHRVLILDAAMQPMEIVSWDKAVMKLFEGKAEVLEEYPDVPIRSVSLTIQLPAVMRMFRCMNRRKFVKFSRLNIFWRDGYRCQYCGKVMPKEKLTLDHILPRCKRTPASYKSWTNIVSACKRCNQVKGGRTPEEAGMKLLRKPVRLEWAPTMLVPENYPEQWRPYLEWIK